MNCGLANSTAVWPTVNPAEVWPSASRVTGLVRAPRPGGPPESDVIGTKLDSITPDSIAPDSIDPPEFNSNRDGAAAATRPPIRRDEAADDAQDLKREITELWYDIPEVIHAMVKR